MSLLRDPCQKPTGKYMVIATNVGRRFDFENKVWITFVGYFVDCVHVYTEFCFVDNGWITEKNILAAQ